MACRKNVNALSAQEKADLITAIKALKADGRYNQYVAEHMQAMGNETPSGSGRNSAHRGPAFLPWHREFLKRFEADLQSVIPGIGLPYWDWASDSGLADPETATIWGTDLMGGNGDPTDGDIVKTGPFAFDAADPSSWTIADNNGNDTGTGLQRSFGTGSVANLPTQNHVNTIQAITPYDQSSWDTGSGGYRNANEGWATVDGNPAPNTHNAVHVWVGGSMLPGTSPNDPVFFLHHCFVDKLWADWQALHPGEAYVPSNSEPADLNGHREDDVMYPWSTRVSDVLDHRAMGYVYDTDAPIVTQETFSIVFNDTPEGVTTVRSATFDISACGNLTFNIIAGPNNPGDSHFDTPLGTTVVVDADDEDKARVWISYTGTTAGDTALGSVTIECVETGVQYVIPISANTIAKPTVATVLVLDQSGSMNSDAGDGRKRIDVLKESAPIFVDLLGEDDGIGIVRFDHDAYLGTAIATAGAFPFGAGRTAAKSAISAHTPNPAGFTSIGDGIDLAHTQLSGLPAGSYDETAIVVLTDGIENRSLFIADVASIIDDKVFGIGLGTADQINPAALTSLTNGTGGYVLMTGTLDTNDYFILQKYFLQILAGVTNADVVLDPEGWVAPGQKIRIPFKLNEADITTDVIMLAGDVMPDAFRFHIETPSGAMIEPGTAAATPGIDFSAGGNALIYRISLPTPVAGFEEREGIWHAVLQINEKGFWKYLSSLDNYPAKIEQAQTHGLRYSVNVHSRSSLNMKGRLIQNSREPGALMTIQARLNQFGLPLGNRCHVKAILKRPDGSEKTVTLDEVEPGEFEYSFTAQQSGDYNVRLLASGHSLRNKAFSREQLLSGSVWIGGNNPVPTTPDPSGGGQPGSGGVDNSEKFCRLLMCWLKQDSVQAFLKRHKIDGKALLECVEHTCKGKSKSAAIRDLKLETVVTEALKATLKDPQMIAVLAAVDRDS